MRVAIDARELCGTPTGVGRYLAGLLREWTAPGAPPAHEFVLYCHRPPTAPLGATVRILGGEGGTRWEQHDLRSALARDQVDVLFSPAYSTPLVTRVPRVVAIHDISFHARPDWFRWPEGVRRRLLARASAAVARAVLTISEFSRTEIITRMGVAPSKVHVIPPGIDRPIPSSELPARRSAQVLYVGSVFNRRNLPDLIAAFSALAQRHADAELHIVGDNRSHPFVDLAGVIAGVPAASRIHWHRYAPDEQLRQLYRDARAFGFLSEYEGLGLTPLEALSAGVPSVLLDTPVARESCGGAALYVGLHDVEATTSALERLLFDEPTRARLLAEAPSVLARYDWTRAAHETLALLEGVA